MHRRFPLQVSLSLSLVSRFPPPFCANVAPSSSLLMTPINGQGRAAPWTPMISRLSRRDADIEIARWCNYVKRRGKGEERWSELGLNYRQWLLSQFIIYGILTANGILVERSYLGSHSLADRRVTRPFIPPTRNNFSDISILSEISFSFLFSKKSRFIFFKLNFRNYSFLPLTEEKFSLTVGSFYVSLAGCLRRI